MTESVPFVMITFRKGGVAVVDDLFDILTKFVAIAGTIDYGFKAIKLLIKMYDKLKSPRKFKRK